jgi:hypothetical protein
MGSGTARAAGIDGGALEMEEGEEGVFTEDVGNGGAEVGVGDVVGGEEEKAYVPQCFGLEGEELAATVDALKAADVRLELKAFGVSTLGLKAQLSERLTECYRLTVRGTLPCVARRAPRQVDFNRPALYRRRTPV